jgi:hypothetical protein
MWLRGLGLRRHAAARRTEAAEIARWQGAMDTPWGEVRYLRPAVNLSASTPRWELPPAPPGSHPPSFV